MNGLAVATAPARVRRSAAPTTRRRGGRCRRSPTRATPTRADEIWLTEHPPVYTLGLAGRREHLLRDNGIPASRSIAAGRSPITVRASSSPTAVRPAARAALGIRDDGPAPRGGGDRMARRAGHRRVRQGRRAGRVRAPRRRGSEDRGARAQGAQRLHAITALAVNVAMDLAPFADIDPCGYPGLAVTQLADLGVRAHGRGGRRRAGAAPRRAASS